MKPLTLVLTGSIAVNVALLILLAAGQASSSSIPAGDTHATTVNGAPAKPIIDENTWPSISASDFAKQAALLRASGFPPAIVRAILQAQISESFAARMKAIDPDAENRPFWKTYASNPGVQLAQRKLYREQEKMLRDVLGNDAEVDDPMARVFQRRGLGDLPAEKSADVRRVMTDINDRRQDVYATMLGSMLPDDRAKLAAIDKEQHAALAQILSPQELENYDLRASNTASSLRYELSAFDATEQEFRTLYKLRDAFAEQFAPMYTAPSQQEMKARNDAQKALNEQIKTALGSERYADYERATDYNYRQTSQLVTRLELPPETTNQVYAVQKDITQRAQALRTDRNLTPENRNAQLAALVAEAETKISTPLGASGYEAYKQYGGTWIQNLVPRPPPGKK